MKLTIYDAPPGSCFHRDHDHIAAALDEWPDGGWYQYETPEQQKRTLADWRLIPAACRRLLALLAIRFAGRSVADFSLWGAGLSDMRPGDFLDVHLDHDVHPHLGLRRTHNIILFLDDAVGGGDLVFGRWPAELRVPSRRGRLCRFETDDAAWHRVERVLDRRRTLSIFFYDPGCTVDPKLARRPRACFYQTGTATEAPQREGVM